MQTVRMLIYTHQCERYADIRLGERALSGLWKVFQDTNNCPTVLAHIESKTEQRIAVLRQLSRPISVLESVSHE